jgi:predicted O-methyltransferase YrrM
MIKELIKKITDPKVSAYLDAHWEQLDRDFYTVQNQIPEDQRMPRSEISFHEDTKLLGYLTLLSTHLPGDLLEIGVWKGKSLAFMNRVKQSNRKVIGIDPLELKNQATELSFYKKNLYSDGVIIPAYSELAVEKLLQITTQISVLHIDGGHETRHVLLDFLLYEKNVVSGGFVLFDDYRDFEYSPEVGPAVDLLRVGGLFNNYKIFGNVPGFESSYLLQKK